MYAFVDALGSIAELLLYEACQLDAALHVLVLHQLEDDVAFAGVRVEAFVLLLVALLERDDGVLALGDGKVVGGSVHTKRVSLSALRSHLGSGGIRVDADEEVGLGAIGDVGTLVQLDEHIRLARIDHLDVLEVLLHELAESKGHGQIDILFLRRLRLSAGVFPAVTGIDDQRIGQSSQAPAKQQQSGYISFHHRE